MMVKQLLFSVLFLLFIIDPLASQVVVNEYVSSNSSGFADEDQDYSDWLELYNTSDQSINLKDYKLCDNRNDDAYWVFPDITMPAHSYLVVFASGKNRHGISVKYHSIIRVGDSWKYFVPLDSYDLNWRELNYNDSGWKTGPSGFGFGDNDDATVLENASVVLIRKEFFIDDVSAVTDLKLHVDYDDGFVAFINGQIFAMSGIAEYNDDYTIVQTAGHEAVMYAGGTPEQFDISDAIPYLKNGKNIIAIQGHNAGSNSTDFTLIPFLTVGSTRFTVNDVEDFISVENGNLHTDFKIDSEGETIYLFNADSQLVDSTKAVVLANDISYGRFPDGSDSWSFFKQPTPGSANSDPQDSIIVESIIFSHKSGFYSDSFRLALSATSKGNGAIRYSVGGYFPTMFSGLYTEPITISSNSVVRAAWFDENGNNGPVATSTYIFDPPNNLPVISLSMDPSDLWDWNNGIYVLGPYAETSNPYFGANFWQDWEKPVHFEFFDNEQHLQIDQVAGVKIAGNWSRANDQKSLALFARKSYGNGAFNYKFFADRKNDSFESILLRNSGNDWRYTMFRDGLISEIARDMDMERLAYQPSKVFLNGQYWGIHNVREKPGEHYFEENFGVDEENLNLLENSGEIIYGKATDYAKLRNFINTKPISEEENYNQVSEQMDISCFTDYQILEIYVDNGDWPGNNIKFWKTNAPTSKWRWLIFDTDFGFNLYHTSGNTMEFATEAYGPDWPNPPWSTLFLRKLLTNQEFKNTFINRFSDCLNTNLSAGMLLPKVDSVQNLLSLEIENHLTRWGFSYDNWLYEVQRIKVFIANREDEMRGYLQDYFGFNNPHTITLSLSDNQAGKIKINTIMPNEYPFKGSYFKEVPITLKAIPNPGYRFVRWEGASALTDRSITVNLTGNNSFIAVFEPAHDDERSVVINEINYKSPDELDAGDWLEIYNSGNQTVDLSGWKLKDSDPKNEFAFPEGLLLYPEGYLVITTDRSKFEKIFPLVKNITDGLSFGLSSNGDAVYLYDSRQNLIDKVNYGVKAPWPVEACGLGPTLELKNPSYNNELAANWRAYKTGGTPGRENSSVVSTETFSYNQSDAVCYPTVFHNYTTLQFRSANGGPFTVIVLDINGKVFTKVDGFSMKGSISTINLFSDKRIYPVGIYMVRVVNNEKVQTIKVLKR